MSISVPPPPFPPTPPALPSPPASSTDGGQLPPHINATFFGSYYKASAIGGQKENYRVTVKIPESLIRDENRSAVGVFRDRIAPKNNVLGMLPGFNGVAICHLESTDRLPDKLPLYKLLDWTGSHSGLAKIAELHAPAVNPGYYMRPHELRHAIRMYLEDPKAFTALQDKQSGHLSEERKIAEELEALGYE